MPAATTYCSHRRTSSWRVGGFLPRLRRRPRTCRSGLPEARLASRATTGGSVRGTAGRRAPGAAARAGRPRRTGTHGEELLGKGKCYAEGTASAQVTPLGDPRLARRYIDAIGYFDRPLRYDVSTREQVADAEQGCDPRAGSARTPPGVPAARLRAAQAPEPAPRLDPAALLRLAVPGSQADAAAGWITEVVATGARGLAPRRGSSTRSPRPASSSSPPRSPTPGRPRGRTRTSTCGSRSSPAPTPPSGCASSRVAVPGCRSASTAPARLSRRSDRYADRAPRHAHRVGRARGPLAHRPDRGRALQPGPAPPDVAPPQQRRTAETAAPAPPEVSPRTEISQLS